MLNDIHSRVYRCKIMHRRVSSPKYRFTYRVFSVLLDIDELPRLRHRLRCFSHNRFNLLSVRDRDHGPRDGTPLRPWIERELSQFGIELAGGRVMLLCMPRILGYAFNPLSIWYCWHADGRLRALVCEVKNTFGEQHCYLLHDGGRPMPWPVRARRAKQFHVSPLISMHGHYRFYFAAPDARLNIVIRETEHHRPFLTATQRGRGAPLSDRELLGCVTHMPLLAIKVITMIHWQAFKIWLRGARYHRKPQPPGEAMSAEDNYAPTGTSHAEQRTERP